MVRNFLGRVCCIPWEGLGAGHRAISYVDVCVDEGHSEATERLWNAFLDLIELCAASPSGGVMDTFLQVWSDKWTASSDPSVLRELTPLLLTARQRASLASLEAALQSPPTSIQPTRCVLTNRVRQRAITLHDGQQVTFVYMARANTMLARKMSVSFPAARGEGDAFVTEAKGAPTAPCEGGGYPSRRVAAGEWAYVQMDGGEGEVDWMEARKRYARVVAVREGEVTLDASTASEALCSLGLPLDPLTSTYTAPLAHTHPLHPYRGKAGALNFALDVLRRMGHLSQQPSLAIRGWDDGATCDKDNRERGGIELLSILDCRHMASREFWRRTLRWFFDGQPGARDGAEGITLNERVAYVQLPQHFADLQGVEKLDMENDHIFRMINALRGGCGGLTSCGTNSVWRVPKRFEGRAIVEDTATSHAVLCSDAMVNQDGPYANPTSAADTLLRLVFGHGSAGSMWHSEYVRENLVTGLAKGGADYLAALHRWSEGAVQVLAIAMCRRRSHLARPLCGFALIIAATIALVSLAITAPTAGAILSAAEIVTALTACYPGIPGRSAATVGEQETSSPSSAPSTEATTATASPPPPPATPYAADGPWQTYFSIRHRSSSVSTMDTHAELSPESPVDPAVATPPLLSLEAWREHRDGEGEGEKGRKERRGGGWTDVVAKLLHCGIIMDNFTYNLAALPSFLWVGVCPPLLIIAGSAVPTWCVLRYLALVLLCRLPQLLMFERIKHRCGDYLSEAAVWRSQQMCIVSAPLHLSAMVKGVRTAMGTLIHGRDTSYWTSFGSKETTFVSSITLAWLASIFVAHTASLMCLPLLPLSLPVTVGATLSISTLLTVAGPLCSLNHCYWGVGIIRRWAQTAIGRLVLDAASLALYLSQPFSGAPRFAGG
ncbi:unnamed protein product [Vitrella brassicaformis CCMP3155]|uniref:Uncharacterized protein n=2 Tax=Vitrella brassicaformis TaxID=1169539 RepID=A0A0G4GYC2_VITBC|nr:unnamed protein product [Vitrella brassicaformis CCMP3155]|eukprot:CEM36126.1 unnamed protein product [Vitrella brassicaformis CCMP3155]